MNKLVINVHDRLENIKLWINAWDQSEQLDYELVIIQNHHEPQPEFKDVCKGVKYIRRVGVGYDIGSFQDICKERLEGFDNDWQKLLFVCDDWIPMRKTFLKEFDDKYLKNTVVCNEMSNIIKPHIRTSAFLIDKNLSKKLRFEVDPITTKEDCWNFEHRTANSFLEQCKRNNYEVKTVSHIWCAPIWDSGHHKHTKRILEYETNFYEAI